MKLPEYRNLPEEEYECLISELQEENRNKFKRLRGQMDTNEFHRPENNVSVVSNLGEVD